MFRWPLSSGLSTLLYLTILQKASPFADCRSHENLIQRYDEAGTRFDLIESKETMT